MKAYGHHFLGDDELIDLLVTYEIGVLHLFAISPKGMKMNAYAWSDPIHVRTLKGLDHGLIFH